MKVAVFGATGGIGSQIVRFALQKNYQVHAYVRNPDKMDKTLVLDERLRVFVGQVNNYEPIKAAMDGCDAVVVALGISMKPGHEDTSSIEAHQNIIAIMRESGIQRLVDWSTPSVKSKEDVTSCITTLPGIMAGIFLPKAKKTLLAVSELVTNSGLDWTMVRFMAPKDTPYTGKVKVSFGKNKLKFAVSRADIAAFMVEQIESTEYLHRMPIIGS